MIYNERCNSQNPSWEFFWGKSPAPECESARDIGRWDSLVSVSPEPGTSSHCTLSLFLKQSQHPWNISPWWNIRILQTIRWCWSAAAEQHHSPCSWSCTSSQTSRLSLYCLQNKIENFKKWRWRRHSRKKRKNIAQTKNCYWTARFSNYGRRGEVKSILISPNVMVVDDNRLTPV